MGPKEAVVRMRKVIVNPIEAFKEIALVPDLMGGRLIFYFIGVAMTLNMLAIFNKLDGLAFNATDLNPVYQNSYLSHTHLLES